MMSANNKLHMNVTGLHNGSVYEDVLAFLSKCRKKNESTAKIYEKGLSMFFMWYKNKQLIELGREDVEVRNATIIRYQDHLIETSKYAASTINKYMSSLFSFYEFLEINDYPVKAEHVKVDMLYVDKNKNSHGEMNDYEARLIREYVRPQKKGIEKAALIRTAYTTSLRKSEILSLTWDDIKKHPTQDVYIISVVQKFKKNNEVPISEDLYNELSLIKEQKYYKRYKDNRIFHLSKTTIQKIMKEINENIDLHDEKGVVFHSLRNVMGGWLEESGSTILEIQEHFNHSNPSTYIEHYKHKTKDFTNSPSVRFELEIDDNVFDDMSKEELLELITTQKGGVLSQLKLAANKMKEERVVSID